MTIAQKFRVAFPFVVGASMVLGLIYYKTTNNTLIISRTETEMRDYIKRREKEKEAIEQKDSWK